MWLLNLAAILTIVGVISVLWTERRGAPWAPTTLGRVSRMLEMAEVGPDDLVYDLGCGDGRTIVAAATRRGARAVGIEIDPLRYAWCQALVTILGLRGQVQVVYGDFFSQDLSQADVVTCYLLQQTNEKLQDKFVRELRPGTRIISHAFTFPGLHLLRHDDRERLYLYNLAR